MVSRNLSVLLLLLACAAHGDDARAQNRRDWDQEFGPVVRAYLGYLRNEQEVVDDRVSRREVSRAYYRRNSNRIRALRQAAIRIARETRNDYLPELEAAARDELTNLFETPPNPENLRVGEVLDNTFRYLGPVRAGEKFYIFTRLDPYEQAELMQKRNEKARHAVDTPPAAAAAAPPSPSPATPAGEATSRPRRVIEP